MVREERGHVVPMPAAVRPVGRRPVVDLLDLGRSRRVTLVIAAAGWGKTTAVASWSCRTRTAWLRHWDEADRGAGRFIQNLVEQLAPHADRPAPAIRDDPGAAVAICDWLRTSLHEDLVVVVDDLHELAPGGDAGAVVEHLCRYAPARLHVVLVSRCEPPFSLERLRGQGLVAEISATELALDVADIAALLRRTVGEAPAGLATLLWERTGGWPAAVGSALDALRGGEAERSTRLVEQLVRPGQRFHAYLAEEVVGAEPAPVRALLRRLAVFGEARSTAGIAPGSDDAESLLADLHRRGLVRRVSSEGVRWSLVRPLQDYFDHEAVLSADERCALHRAAAQECLAREAPGEALRHLLAAGDHAACAALLLDHGAALVRSGQVGTLLEAAALPAPHLDDPRIQQVLGQARHIRGQWAAAQECYRRAGQDGERLEPSLAWRVAHIAFTQGQFPEVRALHARTVFAGEDTADEAQMLALAATACRMVGDTTGLRIRTEQAVRTARRSGEPRAWAAAHGVLALKAGAEGDRRLADAHHGTALECAEADDDLAHVATLRVSQAAQLVDLGLPRVALEEAQAGLVCSERCENPFLVAQALTARGRAHVRLGALERAAADFRTAVDLLQRMGSRFLAWPLCGLGDVHRTRGNVARARAAYEEALALAEPCHDVLGLGSALTGLARIRAVDDLAAARALADRAVALGDGLREVPAVLARGWVALLAGDRQAAATDAARAGAAARRRRDSAGLAESIVLGVLAASQVEPEADLLREAIDIWHETGCRVEEAAARLVAARVGARVEGPGEEVAHEILRECGVDLTSPRRPAGPLAVARRSAPLASIRTLGAFQVLRDGVPVPKAAWQSKKARDLLKLLVARRRPVPREQLMELLWPEVDPARSGNRLSVLLSMVRDVLQPVRSGDGPLVTDGNAVWLDHAQVAVDVEDFLGRAGAALEAHRRGERDATARLVTAEAAYVGGFLDDDPYQEWAEPLAEEVRATYLAVLRAVVGRLRDVGDVDGVVRYTLRLLGQDGYDEEAHLDLVALLLGTGRLGEARRRYQIYVRRMKEIGEEPGPMPRVRAGGGRSSNAGSSLTGL
jgi:DNA-binding SARP family transcriptional activator/tetratricopeptide (TPR) repeat protein